MNRLIHSSQQFSTLIKTTRKARGLTQAEVASRLSISQNRFSELERDASGLTVDRLLVLARMLGLELFVQRSGAPSGAGSSPTPGASDSDW